MSHFHIYNLFPHKFRLMLNLSSIAFGYYQLIYLIIYLFIYLLLYLLFFSFLFLFSLIFLFVFFTCTISLEAALPRNLLNDNKKSAISSFFLCSLIYLLIYRFRHLFVYLWIHSLILFLHIKIYLCAIFLEIYTGKILVL